MTAARPAPRWAELAPRCPGRRHTGCRRRRRVAAALGPAASLGPAAKPCRGGPAWSSVGSWQRSRPPSQARARSPATDQTTCRACSGMHPPMPAPVAQPAVCPAPQPARRRAGCSARETRAARPARGFGRSSPARSVRRTSRTHCAATRDRIPIGVLKNASASGAMPGNSSRVRGPLRRSRRCRTLAAAWLRADKRASQPSQSGQPGPGGGAEGVARSRRGVRAGTSAGGLSASGATRARGPGCRRRRRRATALCSAARHSLKRRTTRAPTPWGGWAGGSAVPCAWNMPPT